MSAIGAVEQNYFLSLSCCNRNTNLVVVEKQTPIWFASVSLGEAIMRLEVADMFRELDPATKERALREINFHITPELAWGVLGKLTRNHAPSQTIQFTQAPAIKDILSQHIDLFHFYADFEGTGNIVIKLTKGHPNFWFFAHADEISYLFKRRLDDETTLLVPFCSHRAVIEHKAVALRFDSDSEGRVVAEGSIRNVEVDSVLEPAFISKTGAVRQGDRVVYHCPSTRNGDLVMGHQLDNAAGVASCLLAALALERVFDHELPVAFALTDEEEGPADSNATFSRGARRLKTKIPSPDLCVVVDAQDADPEGPAGGAAWYTEKASRCRGAVVPPHLYASFRSLMNELQKTGIEVRENTQNVGRSDDVVCYEMTPNVLLIGYSSKDRHFNRAAPTVSLSSIVNLSKAIAFIALHA